MDLITFSERIENLREFASPKEEEEAKRNRRDKLLLGATAASLGTSGLLLAKTPGVRRAISKARSPETRQRAKDAVDVFKGKRVAKDKPRPQKVMRGLRERQPGRKQPLINQPVATKKKSAKDNLTDKQREKVEWAEKNQRLD